MERYEIYKDIAERTNGDIYVGVVGPVRTGKSTLIARMMETLVLPNIPDIHVKNRAKDELPQSADGRTIMTTQPKFVPAEAVAVSFDNEINFNVRMIDCVGYMIDGVLGANENDVPRLVKTPWSEEELPFETAAEIGTKKVICDHSSVGILVTSDGSVTDIGRSNYIFAEERVVRELKETGKPFVIVLNSRTPKADGTQKLRLALEEKYQTPTIALNASDLSGEEIGSIFAKLLEEFPLRSIEIELPRWMRALPRENEMISEIIHLLKDALKGVKKMSDAALLKEGLKTSRYLSDVQLEADAGDGSVRLILQAKDGLFYDVLSKECACEIKDEFQLISCLKTLTEAKSEYEKIRSALDSVRENGYGVVMPTLDDMTLEEPELIKNGSNFGVKLKASAPSMHIMRVDIDTEINPIVGTEQQGEELVKYLLSEFENDPKGIWETNMFGKSLHMLVKEGLNNKLSAMPTEVQGKMRKTVGRIINEGRGGVICILL